MCGIIGVDDFLMVLDENLSILRIHDSSSGQVVHPVRLCRQQMLCCVYPRGRAIELESECFRTGIGKTEVAPSGREVECRAFSAVEARAVAFVLHDVTSVYNIGGEQASEESFGIGIGQRIVCRHIHRAADTARIAVGSIDDVRLASLE